MLNLYFHICMCMYYGNILKTKNKHIYNSTVSNSEEFIIDAVVECFSFASKSVIHSSFGSNVSNELSQNIANGYLLAWNEMEERIINNTPVTKEREEIFNAAINLMRNSVLEIIELNESENKNEEHVFLNHVTANPELYPTQTHILDEAVTAITAGTHTTGNAMAWLLYYISIHPNIQQQMCDEISSVFHNEDMKQNEKTADEWKEELEKCKTLVFCQQVIFETLRITTMAPWAARVNYESDMILKNLEGVAFFIPKNMPVIIGLGCALKDEKVWSQPEIFDPDRWRKENMNRMQKYSKTLIFGGFGKRICPGYKFFHLESLVFLATILPCVEFALVDENLPKIMKFKHGLVTSPTETISLRVSLR